MVVTLYVPYLHIGACHHVGLIIWLACRLHLVLPLPLEGQACTTQTPRVQLIGRLTQFQKDKAP